MQLTRSTILAPTIICATIGVCVGGTFALLFPPRFASTATMRVRSADATTLDAVLPGLLRASVTATQVPPQRIRVHRIDGSASAFQVSVIDSDARKGQEIARALVDQLTQAKHASGVALEVIDMPNRQNNPGGPDPVALTSTGLVTGGMLGLLIALLRSRRMPARK